MIEPILLTSTRVLTFEQQQQLPNASGFFFERDERLYLVTSRHVLVDEPSKHYPDRIEIELHVDRGDLAKSTGLSIPADRVAAQPGASRQGRYGSHNPRHLRGSCILPFLTFLGRPTAMASGRSIQAALKAIQTQDHSPCGALFGYDLTA